MRHQCKWCGRFFSSPLPEPDFCGPVCSDDHRANRERWDRLCRENREALARMSEKIEG